jgi:two-component system NarL family sensor kinase
MTSRASRTTGPEAEQSADRRDLERAPDTRTRDLTILNAISEALNSAPEVEEALERTLKLVAELLGLRSGWIWLIDPDTGHFYHAVSWNLPPYLEEPVRMRGVSCRCIDEFKDGELTPKNIDVIECSRLRPAVQKKATSLTHGLRYHASIPLYFQHKPLGIINVTGPEWRRLTDEDLRLLSTIAYEVGIAVERARLGEESARLARAEERARIAREIHDTLAQSLTAIALHVEGAIQQLEHSPERARKRLHRALDTARQSLEEARTSVLNLRGPLAGRPLAEALASLARSLTSETGMRTHVRVEGGQRLPLRVEAELFRIAQEALQNVRRHAGARNVWLTMGDDRGRVRLVVRDDGRGFDPAAVPETCQGLLGMRERARLMEGTFRVISRPGQGTRVTVSVPYRGDNR